MTITARRPRRRRRLAAAAAAAATMAGLATATVVAATPAGALDNGLALVPPMGWNDWNAFGCNVDQQLVEQTADAIVSSGMRDAGYQYSVARADFDSVTLGG